MSQVTIGSNEEPNTGALLDLKMNNGKDVNSSKGLGLPRVELKNIRTEKDLGKTMGAAQDNTLNHLDHIGLVVYNIGMNIESEETRFCPGIHVWDGEKWQPFVPYPEIRTLKGDYISYKRGFQFLDPNSSKGWPKDKEEARANGYYQLGRIVNTDKSSPNGTEDISDQRPGESSVNTYTTSRFYVGYKLLMEGYQIKRSLSCSTDEPNWDEIAFLPEVYIDTTKVFDEGVWMTQNLRTTKLPDGTNITKRTTSNYGDSYTHIPQYFIPGADPDTNPNAQITENGGVLYNWSAAVAVGKDGGLPSFPSTQTGIDEGNDAHPDVMYKGICPEGWYLPSNQEWTDLANGVAQSVSNTTATLFANKLSGAATTIPYGVNLSTSATSGVGGYLGQAMKTTTSVSGFASGGQSKTRAQSGFDAYLIGSSTIRPDNSAIGKYQYGEASYFWTSSINPNKSTSAPNRIYVYHTSLKYNDVSFYQGYHNTFQTFSVRCKKETK